MAIATSTPTPAEPAALIEVYYRGEGWPASRLRPLSLSSPEEMLLVSGLATLARQTREARQ